MTRPGRTRVSRGAVDRPVHRHRPGGRPAREGGEDRAQAPARRRRQQELVAVDEGDPVGVVAMPVEDLAIGGKLRRPARGPGEGNAVDDAGAGEGGEERRALVPAVAVVGEKEAVDAEDAMKGDPLEEIGAFVLEDGPYGEAQAASCQGMPLPVDSGGRSHTPPRHPASDFRDMDRAELAGASARRAC
jgi:hypothetical protein